MDSSTTSMPWSGGLSEQLAYGVLAIVPATHDLHGLRVDLKHGARERRSA